jgi:D-alanyl-D-alanine carboxypeptidase
LAAAAALALLAAACGGDDGDSEATADEATGVEDDAQTVDVDAEGTEVEVDEAGLQATLGEWRTQVDAFGATLSIRVPGNDDIHLASGVDDRNITNKLPSGTQIEHTETPMTTEGTYPILAVTRTFTAAIALQLVDEGRLALDEPVQAWLPELPKADQITLAMLLDNTSGLGEWDPTPALVDDPARSFTPEGVLAKHLEVPPTAPPGEGYAYTSAGYIAVGLLIERVLDQDLADVIAERIAEPLSLDDTFLSDGTTKPTRHGWFSFPDDPDPSRPHDIFDVPLEAMMTTGWADSGMISSSQDLLDWAEALYTGDFLGEETTATMLEMRNPDPALGNTLYGLGVGGYCFGDTGCSPDATPDVVGHSGNLIYRVFVGYHPVSGTVTVVESTSAARTYETVPALLADVFQQVGLT